MGLTMFLPLLTRHPPPPPPPEPGRPTSRGAPGAALPASAPITAFCPCLRRLHRSHSRQLQEQELEEQEQQGHKKTRRATQRLTLCIGRPGTGTTSTVNPGAAARRAAVAAFPAVEAAASLTAPVVASRIVRDAAFRIEVDAAVATRRARCVRRGGLVAAARGQRDRCERMVSLSCRWWRAMIVFISPLFILFYLFLDTHLLYERQRCRGWELVP
ncbi:hypothetical protein EDB81DRAFT_495654 [Dactylonectria macrodidyma]|uniref:Uncharacterized protein n=1 Tax=Dactylonectria macrodidyma TaxID=307937 RepID=A0A9P9J7V8_9HYPO|nr:hypothetical protein EDB81DRAFT_495654 [Dactylonectria macrodidyma]